MSKVSIIVLLVSINSYIAYGQLLCSNASLVNLDKTMARALNVGKYFRGFPENYNQVDKFCKEEFELIKQIDEYKTRCMRNLPKQLTSIIIYTTKSMINSLCKKDSKRLRRLLSGAPCANTAQKEYARCVNRYIDDLQGITQADEKLKIPHTCCQYHKIFPCMRSLAKKHDVCTAEKIEANIEYMSDIFTNTINTLCGDWTEDSDKCQKLAEPPKKDKNIRRTYSFILPFIDVLDSFPEVY